MTENQISNYALKPELLSPAGDWESLRAAVLNGADAVYLGTREFNARANAKNFTLDELRKAVEYCHQAGVKVYLTLNILVKNSEIDHFFEVLARVYALGIDGIILQHISFVDIVKKNYPDLAVFISTQGAIGNSAATALVKNADRVIAPREMPLAEIKKMVDGGTKVEIFVHGALCFSYSGLCLFSSFVASRSGNRGTCAQLCRQKYNNQYPMSTKELCTVRSIPDFIKAGVTAFKIEGRMRSALYVAVATRLYRKAIDSYLKGEFKIPKQELSEIEVVFNREFTEGLINGAKEIVSPERPMNRGVWLGTIEKGQIVLNRAVKVGDGLGIWNKDNVTGAVVQRIMKNGQPVDHAAAGEQVELGIGAKEGAKIYLTSDATIKIEPDFTLKRLPVKLPARKNVQAVLPRIVKQKAPAMQRFMARAYTLDEARQIAQAGADIVFYDIFSADFPESSQWPEQALLGAYIPRIVNDTELNRACALLNRKKAGAVMAGNAGFLARRTAFNGPVYLDYSINGFNDLDTLFFRQYKAIPVLSPELSLVELTAFKDREVVIYCHGDIILMNTCIPLNVDRLEDDKGYVFPVRREDGYWQILNSRPFGMFNDVKKLRTIGFNQFYIDQMGKSAQQVSYYRQLLKDSMPDRRERQGYTAGHLYKGVE
jgi:collagenase-like PrtC family protease